MAVIDLKGRVIIRRNGKIFAVAILEEQIGTELYFDKKYEIVETLHIDDLAEKYPGIEHIGVNHLIDTAPLR